MSDSEGTLGNTTKFTAASEFAAEYGYTALRFYLLRIAQSITPDERLRICWRYLLPDAECVEVIYSDERKKARTKGTMKCGSVWSCPACMQYIQARRAEELKTALDNARDKYFPVMATYTIRHGLGDNLADVMKRMSEAFGWMKKNRPWRTVRDEYMMIGSVRSTEITYGLSGWHPHYHELIMVDNAMLAAVDGDVDFFAASLQQQLTSLWLDALARFGLDASESRALAVTGKFKDIAGYVTKYGKLPSGTDYDDVAQEVSRPTTKIARGGNKSVLDLLFEAREPGQSRMLWLDYVAATKGRSQLQWSKGLRAALKIAAISDEKAAQGIDTPTDRLLAQVEPDLWRWIDRAGYLAQLMTIANQGDAGKLEAWLGRVRELSYDGPNNNKNLTWTLGH